MTVSAQEDYNNQYKEDSDDRASEVQVLNTVVELLSDHSEAVNNAEGNHHTPSGDAEDEEDNEDDEEVVAEDNEVVTSGSDDEDEEDEDEEDNEEVLTVD